VVQWHDLQMYSKSHLDMVKNPISSS
jgi:hypothetical protein